MRSFIFLGIALLGMVACSSQQAASPAPLASAPPVASSASSADVDARVASVVPAPTPAPAPVAADPAPSFDDVARVLAVTGASCPASLPSDARIRCLYDERYRGDAKAASLAYELLVRWQIVAGVEHAYTMDGGYRGMIRVEPATPTGADRKHLDWIVAALRDVEQVFTEIDRFAADAGAPPPGASAAHAARYRWRPITLRFFRSVAARTPSAYASDWTVAWNLNGSLHTSGDAVRETLVHEIFHLNDYAHPDGTTGDPWSEKALGPIFDTLVRKCGTKVPCLTPYTPAETMVRGGTYYSFQPGNGVREYAAELASRYVREQRAALRGLPSKAKPFKCGPPENAQAWDAMRDEFFNGIDAVPACP